MEAYKLTSGITETPLAEGLSLRRGADAYILDETGAHIWQLVRSGRTEEEICAHLTQSYDDQHASIERDVRRMLRRMSEWGLLQQAQ